MNRLRGYIKGQYRLYKESQDGRLKGFTNTTRVCRRKILKCNVYNILNPLQSAFCGLLIKAPCALYILQQTKPPPEAFRSRRYSRTETARAPPTN